MRNTLRKIFQTATVSLCAAALTVFVAVLVAAACGNRVSISFETFGCTETVTISQRAGTVFEPPADPEKEGYVFAGWYLDEGCTGEAQKLPATMPGVNLTYYARFERLPEQFVLTLNAGGGEPETCSYVLAEGSDLSDILANAVPVREGVTFGGWSYGGKEPPSAMPRQDVTLTARYICSYRIEIYLQSAESEEDYRKEVTYGSGYEGEEVTPRLPEYEHFLFDEAGSTARTMTLGAEETAFRFYFNRERITLRYCANRDNAMLPVTQTELFYGGKVAAQDGVTAEGYLFLGWSETADGATVYAAGERLELSADAVLYAVWAKLYPSGTGGGGTLAVAEYVNADGTRDAWLLYEGQTVAGVMGEDGFFRAGETEGRLDEYGTYLPSDSGRYIGYDLSSSSADEAFGVLTLDFGTQTAVFTHGGDESVGTYSPVYDEREARYTGEYRFAGNGTEFFFRLGSGTFLRKGEEAGEYVLGEISSDKWAFYLNTVLVLDGYGGARLTKNGVTVSGAYCGGAEGLWLFTCADGESFRFGTCEVSVSGMTESVSVFLLSDEDPPSVG